MAKKKEEFSDSLMRELHEIRKKNYRETKDLSSKEKIKKMREYVKKELRLLGYELVSEKRGKYKITSIKKKEAST